MSNVEFQEDQNSNQAVPKVAKKGDNKQQLLIGVVVVLVIVIIAVLTLGR